MTLDTKNLIARRIAELPPYLFARLDALRAEKAATGVDVIPVSIGDPDLPTPEPVVERLREAAGNPAYHRYNETAIPQFRRAIADWYRRRFAVDLDPDREIVPLIGSKEGIAHAPLALVDPGDLVLVPDPGYPVYSIGTELVGGRVSYMPLLAERGWTPDLAEIDPIERSAAKLMWLNYPNNPTAAAGSEEFFAEALDFCRRNQILLCQDAAYSEVTFDGFRASSALSLPGARDYCVEFHSLSKTYNMTGWRIGWAAGNSDVIEALARVKSNMDSGMFAAVEAAGVAALEMPEEWISGRNRVLQARRDRVVAALRRMGLAPEVPAASLYVWTPVPEGFDSSSFAAHVIDEAGVVVTPGLGFGPGGDGYFRISLTTPDERLDEAMDRLARLNF